MSDVRCMNDRKRALHASSTSSSSSRGSACRPQMHPTRLFTSQINSIIKDKDRSRPRNLRRVSPESESLINEGNTGTPPVEPEKTPPQPIFDHLSDREGPSGAEDEDLTEALSVRREILSETIQVKDKTTTVTHEPEETIMAHSDETMQVSVVTVETTTVKHESEDMCMAHSNETIQDTVCTPVASQESPGVMSSSVGLDTIFDPTSASSSSSDHLGCPPIAICYTEVDCRGGASCLKETDDVSDGEERESTLDGIDSTCSKSESSIKKKQKADRRKSKKSKDSDSRRSKRQLLPVASRLARKHNLDSPNVSHQKKKKDQCFKRGSKKREKDSDSDLLQSQHQSLAKISSSERSDDTEASQSDEVLGCKLHTITKHQSFNSCQSALDSQSSDMLSKSSPAPDFISLKLPSYHESLKPDTPYNIPNTPLPSMHSGSPLIVGYPPTRPLFFYESWMSLPPPPPPTEVQGQFQWNTSPASTMLLIPLSSPNQLCSHPVAQTMFAPSQEDKRFQCLQSLHNPPKPSLFGYQLIGDSMLLRFSNQLLRESAIFKEGLRFLGYCVSGQKIGDLLKRLRAGFYHLGKKVVLMIGTNDLCRNTKADQMCHELRRVVDFLQKEVEELVIITIPPVPLIENMEHHWNRLHEYNCFIKQLPQKYKDARISVSDISPLYVLSREEIEEEEMLAVVNAEVPYCAGCLTCMEESEDVDWDCSSLSDEEDAIDMSVVARVLIDTNSCTIKPLDTSGIFFDKKIKKCRLDLFELTYSGSTRKDLIHLNNKGLTVIKDQLVKIL